MFFLVFLSIVGFILLFFISPEWNNTWTNTQVESSSSENGEDEDSWTSYREEIIWNEHY